MRVLVKETVPHYWNAYKHRGEILEVEDTTDNGFYNIIGKSYGVPVEHAEIMNNTYKPQSGQIFKTQGGGFGLFIQAGDTLRMLYGDTNGYNQHSTFSDDMLTRELKYDHDIIEIYDGMLRYGSAGINSYLHDGDNMKGDKPVWVRVVKPSNKIRLNSEYTAEIKGDVVHVGCQTIPLKRLEEILERAKELQD
jgi:hypothetical protein